MTIFNTISPSPPQLPQASSFVCKRRRSVVGSAPRTSKQEQQHTQASNHPKHARKSRNGQQQVDIQAAAGKPVGEPGGVFVCVCVLASLEGSAVGCCCWRGGRRRGYRGRVRCCCLRWVESGDYIATPRGRMEACHEPCGCLQSKRHWGWGRGWALVCVWVGRRRPIAMWAGMKAMRYMCMAGRAGCV